MPNLTPTQIQQYSVTEGKKANPLSPLDWLATQTTTPTTPITTTTPTTPTTGGPMSVAQYNLLHPGDPITTGGLTIPISPTTEIDWTRAPIDTTAVTQAEIAYKAALKQFESMTKDMDEFQKKIATEAFQQAMQAQQAAPTEGWASTLKGLLKQRAEIVPINSEQLYSQALAKYGATPETFAQMTALTNQLGEMNQQIIAAETKYQKQNEMLGNQPIAMPAIVGEQAALARQYNLEKSANAAQASAVAAQIEAMRGNITMAISLADKVVSAATWDYSQKIRDMEWTFSTYVDLFQIMDTKERTAWNDIYTMYQDNKNTKEQETRDIMNMVIDAAKEGVIIDYNPTVDTRETITNKYARRVVPKAGLGKDIKGITGALLSSRIEQEINNAFQGQYGTEGGREKIINALNMEFPGQEATISKLIYSRLPDGWEQQIKGYTPSLENIKSQTQSIFQQYQNAGYSRKQIENQWKIDNNTTTIPPLTKDALDEIFGETKSWWQFWK